MIWIDITPQHGIWKPTNTRRGNHRNTHQKIPAPYKGRPNTKYCLQTTHPEAIDNKIIIYGHHMPKQNTHRPRTHRKNNKNHL